MAVVEFLWQITIICRCFFPPSTSPGPETLTPQQFYVARRVNECAIVREACMKATAKDLEHLRQLNKRILTHEADIEKAREDHRAFHLAIAKIRRKSTYRPDRSLSAPSY